MRPLPSPPYANNGSSPANDIPRSAFRRFIGAHLTGDVTDESVAPKGGWRDPFYENTPNQTLHHPARRIIARSRALPDIHSELEKPLISSDKNKNTTTP